MSIKEQLVEYIAMLEVKLFMFGEQDNFLEKEYISSLQQLQEIESK